MFWSKRKKPQGAAQLMQAQAPQPVGKTLSPTSGQPDDGGLSSIVIQRQLGYRIGNLQGVGKRQRQEDSFSFVNAMDVTEIRARGLLAILADGIGGMADGKLASETVVASLRSEFQTLDYGRDLGAQLRQSVVHANARVYEQLHGEGGSTLVLCLFYQGQLWFCSVGDSALFLLRDGELLRLNREQNVLTDGYMDTIARNSMDPTHARKDREKDALTQFLGMPELEEVDSLLQPLRLHDGDCFLLCSDGVSDVVPETALKECMQQPLPMQACNAIEQAVQDADHPYQDNFTALIVQCGY